MFALTHLLSHMSLFPSFPSPASAINSQQSCRAAAEARGIFSTEALDGLSPSFQNFLSQCLRDLPDRPTAAELLQHRFIKEYNKGLSRRQRELDEAVKALKTHIQIHKGRGGREGGGEGGRLL